MQALYAEHRSEYLADPADTPLRYSFGHAGLMGLQPQPVPVRSSSRGSLTMDLGVPASGVKLQTRFAAPSMASCRCQGGNH
mmetsp:Transcript_31329/g.54384  ORF Transcript_31329/g.54384 Transcript_31329/m.54384 type:complete len:81 (+) Transcript_31329:599-841(+)